MEYRVLEPDEYHKIPPEFPMPPGGLPPDRTGFVAAINEKGEIVGGWALVPVWHSEPLWLRADYRKSPTVIRRLAERMKELCREVGVDAHYAVIKTPVLQKIAEWYGAKPMEGVLVRYEEKD